MDKKGTEQHKYTGSLSSTEDSNGGSVTASTESSSSTPASMVTSPSRPSSMPPQPTPPLSPPSSGFTRRSLSHDGMLVSPPPLSWFQIPNTQWVAHTGLFSKGILVLAPTKEGVTSKFHPRQETSDTSFRLGSRTVNIVSLNRGPKTQKNVLLLQRILSKTDGVFSLAEAEQVVSSEASTSTGKEASALITAVNPTRKAERFTLISTQSEEQPSSGLYIYPWLTKESPTTSKFNGFSQFVTAGCLFGPNLRALDQHGNNFQIVKHSFRFFPDQKIESVYLTDDISLYEAMWFASFSVLTQLIAKTAKTAAPPLLYHLPTFDYIVFGIQLFIQNHITQDALGGYFRQIFERTSLHKTKLSEAAKQHDIAITFFSPFQSLFDNSQISLSLDNSKLAEQVMAMAIDTSTQAPPDEAFFVKNCLQKLMHSTKTPANERLAWANLVNSLGEPKTIENLFKIANALVIALAAENHEPGATCSFLSVAEKQIQVTYASATKDQESCYPPVTCLSLLDNASAHPPSVTSESETGLTYYANHTENTFKKPQQMIATLLQNAGLFAKGLPTTPIEEALEAQHDTQRRPL